MLTLTYYASLAGAAATLGLLLVAMFRTAPLLTRWIFVLGMAVLLMESLLAGLSMHATKMDEMIQMQNLRMLALSLIPGTWLAFSLTYARQGPEDQLKKGMIPLLITCLLPLLVTVCFWNELISTAVHMDSPEGIRWGIRLGGPAVLLYGLLMVGMVLILMNLERTFRSSVGMMRWRIKYMVIGLGLIFAVRAYFCSQILLFRAIDLSREYASIALLLAAPLILRSLLRMGEKDADVYLSHSLISNSITLLLSGVYLLIVSFLAKAITYFGGVNAFPLKAFLVLVSLILLSMLLLSDRLRLYTRRFVSRHFKRPHHEYDKIWLEFTKATEGCVEERELCRHVVKLTASILHALSVSIWLIDEKRESLEFIASTSLSDMKGSELKLSGGDARNVIRAFEDHPEPVDIDASNEKWAVSLRSSHPDHFDKGGGCIGVPLISGQKLMGVMAVSDRVSGIVFTIQDLDLLKCMGNQVASSLSNLQLSRKLLQARELEAFQAMSAFFVHDLKNTASTLNLMVENLPKHFNDPAFREDAFRGVSNSASHINHLIGRLTQLRHDLKIRPESADLNELIQGTLHAWKDSPVVKLETRLDTVPLVRMDRDQMGKVVTNLVLNAIESKPRDGRVEITTLLQDGWVVLLVRDHGCGMSPDFMKNGLFRPFQSSKKGGLGIGMFQSKMIVDAHGGRMEVESQPGQGTQFRILLPRG